MLHYRFNNFYETVQYHGTHHRKKVALFEGENTITYGELLKRVDAFAGYLASAGIEPDRMIGWRSLWSTAGSLSSR